MLVAWALVVLGARLAYASGTVSFPLFRLERPHGIFKRQTNLNTSSFVQESLFDVLPWSAGGSYYVSIAVGTPPQNITAILDTGSSDLYLDATSASACKGAPDLNPCRGGIYTPGASSSYKLLARDKFQISFGDGSTATGDFVTDTVAIGDDSIQNVQFGVADFVNSTTGFAVSLMGVGYSIFEVSDLQYPNMPELLQQAGAINSRLYSVYLDSLDGGTGSILFGGLDTSKFSGDLVTLDLLPSVTTPSNATSYVPSDQNLQNSIVGNFVVNVTSVSTIVNGKTTSVFDAKAHIQSAFPVLLDTGSSAWTVPTKIYQGLTAPYKDSIDEYGNIPCSHQNDDVQIVLQFGGSASISVLANEMIVPIYDQTTGEQYTTSDGELLCGFMAQADYNNEQLNAQGFLTLGDSILRSMYVVFDLDNGQVAIAQAASDVASNSSETSIKVVLAGSNGIANAVGTAATVVTATRNGYSIATELLATQSVKISTLASAVGTATGANAIPSGGRLVSSTTPFSVTGSPTLVPEPSGLSRAVSGRAANTCTLYSFVLLSGFIVLIGI